MLFVETLENAEKKFKSCFPEIILIKIWMHYFHCFISTIEISIKLKSESEIRAFI